MAVAPLLGIAAFLSCCDLGRAAGGLMLQAALPAAHVSVPFNAGVAGSSAEGEFRVLRADLYAFTLEYMFREGDREDQERVRRLVQGIDLRQYPPRYLDEGLSIPVRLSVSRRGEGQPWSVKDGISTKQVPYSFGATGVSRRIETAWLTPGRYLARIEALGDAPEARGISARFEVGKDHFK